MFSADPESLRKYRDYTYERANVYYKKEILGLPAPWTSDQYLNTYKFTNIRRELDRQSKFLIDTVINNTLISDDEKALNCAIFRCFNHGDGVYYLKEWPVQFDIPNSPERIHTFKMFEDEADLKNVEKKKLQSNAYFLSHIRSAANNNYPNLKSYQCNLVQFIYDNRDKLLTAFHNPDAKQACDLIQEVTSFGDFMAYQIWVDWTYMPNAKWTENDYVVSGPGCCDGIDWMIGGNSLVYVRESDNQNLVKYGKFRELYPEYTYEDYIHWFTDNLPKLMSDQGIEWNPAEFQHFMPENQRNWGLMQVENSFCEFNKLNKLMNKCSMRVRYY